MDFLDLHQDKVDGVLHGFDRMLFHGFMQCFYQGSVIPYFLKEQGVSFKGYKGYVQRQTEVLTRHIECLAESCYYEYLTSWRLDKDARAREVWEAGGRQDGLIAVFGINEMGKAISIRRSKITNQPDFTFEQRRCKHYYLYYSDKELGWMHIRIQSWFPYPMHICINGKEYLMRQLKKEGIDFQGVSNGVGKVSDLKRAQELADGLESMKFSRIFNEMAKRVNPHLQTFLDILGRDYKWVTAQAEYATDVMFKDRATLKGLYPSLVAHSSLNMNGEDVLTFFGRKVHPNIKGEVKGTKKRFDQGFRVKYVYERNSIKMYDKGNILRIETTINNSRAFKIFRPAKREGKETMAWVPMGKSVSNLYRFAQVSRQANLRFLNSLALDEQDIDQDLHRMSKSVEVKTKHGKKRRYGGLNLLSSRTTLLLRIISDGRFLLKPFNNATLRQLLLRNNWFSPEEADPKNLKRISGKVSRLLARLRAHKLIKKIGRSSRYRITNKAATIIAKLLQFKPSPLLM